MSDRKPHRPASRPPPRPERGTSAQGIVQGLVLLGRFRREGFVLFDATPQAFLAGLAPWIAFLLVGSVLSALHARPLAGAESGALLLCVLLLPPVVSEAFARLWKREQHWMRYVTATMWCAWLIPCAYLVGLFLASLLLAAGLPPRSAPAALWSVMGFYWLWLHFFLARAGLDVSRLRAAVLVAAQIVSTSLLVAIGGGFGLQNAGLFGS